MNTAPCFIEADHSYILLLWDSIPNACCYELQILESDSNSSNHDNIISNDTN